jgi:3-methylfumaryl-CoA hydratase
VRELTSEQAPDTRRGTDTVSPAAARALHGLLDAPGGPPAHGDPLPPLWHWLAFLPTVPQHELKDDGHPRLEGELARFNAASRMFAGGSFEFSAPLRVGEVLERTSTMGAIEEKTGRSGPLAFVRWRHQVFASGALAVTEEQDIVYRPGPPAAVSACGPAQPVPDAPWAWELGISPTLLFRFSALTYNAHRIHYDRAYATEVEGYPGLVVHGPLQAVALVEVCRREAPARRLASFSFRALSPAFDAGPIHLRGTPAGDEVALATYDHEGRCTMRATAAFLSRDENR